MHACYDNISMHKKRLILPQQGQALLIIILVVVVVMTVVLSLATRSVTNSKITTDEDNSQKAFSAAEAGVEQLLKNPDDNPVQSGSDFGNSTFEAHVVQDGTTSFIFNNGNAVAQDDGADLWLSRYPTYMDKQQDTYTVYWGTGETCPNVAAIEIVLLSGASVTNPTVTHFVFDPCRGGGGGNGFTIVPRGSYPVPGTSQLFNYRGTFTFDNGIVARVIPLYRNSVIAITPSAGHTILPQGKNIESIGTSDQAKRKISVFQSYPRLPVELFPYAIFSP